MKRGHTIAGDVDLTAVHIGLLEGQARVDAVIFFGVEIRNNENLIVFFERVAARMI